MEEKAGNFLAGSIILISIVSWLAVPYYLWIFMKVDGILKGIIWFFLFPIASSIVNTILSSIAVFVSSMFAVIISIFSNEDK